MSNPPDSKSPHDAGQLGRRIRFHYLKSPTFHSIHADGVYGGVTPAGGIHIAFFAERLPIPTQTEVSFDPSTGQVSEVPGSRVAREGVVRELQADVFLSLGGAEALHEWLSTNLAQLRKMTEEK